MPIKARIYKPSKNAMQSGRAATQKWILEYEPVTPRTPDAVMGWVSAGDALNEVRMKFDSRDAAIAFAEQNGFEFTVGTPHQRRARPRSYLDNFKYRAADADSDTK